ncbi:MAG TPA: hypothetical protein VGC11_04110 [Acidimicrobiia bacterium]|jgi:hypothetical protein
MSEGLLPSQTASTRAVILVDFSRGGYDGASVAYEPGDHGVRRGSCGDADNALTPNGYGELLEGREERTIEYAILTSAARRAGLEPNLLDDVAWWRSDDTGATPSTPLSG